MSATGSTQQDAAGTPTVEVVFDPSQIAEDPISIAPENVRIGQDTGVEFVLKTIGEGEQKATFPAQGSITLENGRDGEAVRESDATRLMLRTTGCSEASGSGPVRVPYHVQVEYEGEMYTSMGYPILEEQDPIC